MGCVWRQFNSARPDKSGIVSLNFMTNPEQLRTLSSDELTPLIYERQHKDYRSEYSYFLDMWFWAFRPGLALTDSEAVPFTLVKESINRLLAEGNRLAYWSGGFDLGFHSNTIGTLEYCLPPDVRAVIGIEPDSYIEAKGREAQFDQVARLSAVGLMAKNSGKLGVIFPIPERGGQDPNEFYNRLVRGIGMYRRPGCYHLYTDDDPALEVKKARMTKPEPWCCLHLIRDRWGRRYSTSRLLGLED
jgi:hypothetical protein